MGMHHQPSLAQTDSSSFLILSKLWIRKMYRAADSFYIYVGVCACVYDLISPEINFKI